MSELALGAVRMSPPRPVNWDAAKIVFIFAAVALNAVSKLSSALYLALLAPAMAILLLDLFRRPMRLERENLAGLALLLGYLTFVFIALVNSASNISMVGAVMGMGRFLFAIPLLLALMLYVRDFSTLRLALVGIAIVVAVGNLSVPWQMAFGKLEWLGSDYKRGGFDRYASILGNVTAIGISAGFYFAIILLVMRRGLWKLLICLAIAVSAIASLSKAAIFNVAIPVVLITALSVLPRFRIVRRVPVGAVIGFFVMVAAVIGIALSVPAVQGRILVSLASFGVASAETRTDDVAIGKSFQERLLFHPTIMFSNLDKTNGPFGLLTGAGFGMSSTALVPQEDELSTMAHNQFIEFWALGGVFFLLNFLAILGLVAWRLLSLINESWRQHLEEPRRLFIALLVVYICYFVNLPFANGLVYQPTQAAIFWLFCSLLLLPRRILLGGTRSIQKAASP
ncbi:hypothetical protein GE253_04210 [Niveispirillum sp. SYP-B3756]|uniref:hypothetical protein n=1 Tax=Niveispirillum sp. SYP-B3756 TaxID=2662178 RepID=UPI001290C19C|nr:hypothetical protein [Niveispirillum sp. SYP-B3756]MQP64544.1 hypothetical protein [Niveispirillum sp. SYP-B3756]